MFPQQPRLSVVLGWGPGRKAGAGRALTRFTCNKAPISQGHTFPLFLCLLMGPPVIPSRKGKKVDTK